MGHLVNLLVRFFTSKTLAVVLVGVLAALSVIGTILPQQAMFGAAQIEFWQKQNPIVTFVASPLGLFDVFASVPFWAAIILMFVNLVACTIKRYVQYSSILFRLRPFSIRVQGSLVLHLSLIIVFVGLALSLGTRLDGTIILTEGQGWEEAHDNYVKLSEAPFFKERHKGFRLVLEKFTPTYEKDRYLMDLISEVDVFDREILVNEVTIKTNQPFSFKDFILTQDVYGFSPALTVRDKSGELMVDAYVALKTFQGGREWTFSDFLEFGPGSNHRLVLELFPDFTGDREFPGTRSRVLKEPALALDLQTKEGESLEKKVLLMGETATLGDFSYTFDEVRYWSQFRVVQDAGLGILYLGFGLAFAGLVWRFVPDFFGRYLPRSVEHRPSAPRVETVTAAAPLRKTYWRDAESEGEELEDTDEHHPVLVEARPTRVSGSREPRYKEAKPSRANGRGGGSRDLYYKGTSRSTGKRNSKVLDED